jgi:hypothetical protein
MTVLRLKIWKITRGNEGKRVRHLTLINVTVFLWFCSTISNTLLPTIVFLNLMKFLILWTCFPKFCQLCKVPYTQLVVLTFKAGTFTNKKIIKLQKLKSIQKFIIIMIFPLQLRQHKHNQENLKDCLLSTIYTIPWSILIMQYLVGWLYY